MEFAGPSDNSYVAIRVDDTDILTGVMSLNSTNPILDEDFSSYDKQAKADEFWEPNNISVDITNDRISYTSNGTAKAISLDMTQALDNSAFVVRYKHEVTSFSGTDTTNTQSPAGVSDTDKDTVFGASEDFVGFSVAVDSDGDGDSISAFKIDGGTKGSVVFNRALQVEVLFVEIRRISSTSVEVEIFSDSGFTNSLEQKTLSISSGLDGLQFLKVQDESRSSSNSANIIQHEFAVKDGVT